jgi:hypothetical protein
VVSLVLADVGAGAESPFLLPSLARLWISLAERRGMSALADEMLRGEFFRSYANRNRHHRPNSPAQPGSFTIGSPEGVTHRSRRSRSTSAASAWSRTRSAS